MHFTIFYQIGEKTITKKLYTNAKSSLVAARARKLSSWPILEVDNGLFQADNGHFWRFLGFLGKNPFFERSKNGLLLDFAPQSLRPSENVQKIQFKWGNDFLYP